MWNFLVNGILHFEVIPLRGVIFPFLEYFFFFKKEEQFSILIHFDNNLEENGEISDPQLHQSEKDENEFDEECIVKNIASHIEINNACEVIRRFHFFGN